jgi:hypothetical protein
VPRAKVTSAFLVTLAFGLGVTTSLIFGVYQPAVAVATTSSLSVTITTASEHPLHRTWDSLRGQFHRLTTKSDIVTTTERYLLLAGNDVIKRAETNSELTYTGVCQPNFILIPANVAYAYQKTYYSIYLVCLITVVVLYVLIYQSVAARQRSRRSRSALSALRPPSGTGALLLSDRRTTKTDIDTPQATPLGGVETVLLLPLKRRRSLCDEPRDNDGGGARGSVVVDAITAVRRPVLVKGEGRAEDDVADQQIPLSPKGQGQYYLLPAAQADLQPGGGIRSASVVTSLLRHTIGRRQLSARGSVGGDFLPNIRLAAMLFVVAAVFIVSFFPAFLMSMDILPHSSLVFYMYFAYNIANPIIYSFMNKTFRNELTNRLLRRRRKRAASRVLSNK